MQEDVTHIVLISGGLASFEAGRRVLDAYGKESVELWFFDTMTEDEDLYRFLDDCESFYGKKIWRFAEGRNIWEVFRDKRFIGNPRVDVCSRLLKREYLEKLLLALFPENNVILYLGLEWSEGHRIDTVRKYWFDRGYRTGFPLEWEPILLPLDFCPHVRAMGIEIPRLYQLGFPHNNCGGACVKAGIKQWALLWRIFPQRFYWHESQEQATRRYLKKDVAILRNRAGGRTRPMTLRYLGWRLRRIEKERGSISEYMNGLPSSWSCSCFVPVESVFLDYEEENGYEREHHPGEARR